LVAFHLPGSQAPLPAVFVFSSCYTQGDAGKLPAFHAKLPNFRISDLSNFCLLITLLKLAFRVGRAFQPDKMAASVADPDSFGHREMTALLSFILIKLRPPQ
jgi:hypothetical protein